MKKLTQVILRSDIVGEGNIVVGAMVVRTAYVNGVGLMVHMVALHAVASVVAVACLLSDVGRVISNIQSVIRI